MNSVDSVGGAARSVQRIHDGLLNIDLQSTILVQTKRSNNPLVIGPQNNFENGMSLVCQFLDQSIIRYFYGRPKALFSPAFSPSSYIITKINSLSPDVVHLHWICSGMIKIQHLTKIKAPIVWTFHDMWPFTGGCHSSKDCNNYKDNCGNCPLLVNPHDKDMSHKVWEKKKRFWHNSRLTIVTPSHWLADCTNNSSLFRNNSVNIIPNGLDINIYKYTNKYFARKSWNLPLNKKLILFGAVLALTDPNKGFALLCKAINTLHSRFHEEVELIIFGADKPIISHDFGFPIHYFGQLHDDISISLLYSAADVMVVPSYQEAFGQTASEAQACGCPVVAFNATGLSDIVTHMETGYLATPYESEDLCNGINFVIEDKERHAKLSSYARKKALGFFDIKIIAKQYKELYYSVIQQSSIN